MSFQLGSYSIGKHAYFYRDGDVITVPAAGSLAGASGRNNQPDASDPLYIDLGAIEDWSDDFKSMGDERILKPSPGLMELYDIVEKGGEGMFKFTTGEIQAFAFEVFYRTSAKLTSAGGVFNPISAPSRKGWLHRELYDQNNALVGSMDCYGMLRITGGMGSKEGAVVRPQWEFQVLYSTLATGLINNS